MDSDFKLSDSLQSSSINKKGTSSSSQLQFVTDVFSVTKKVSQATKAENVEDTTRKESSSSSYCGPSRMRTKAPYNTPDLYRTYRNIGYESIIGTLRADSNFKINRNSYSIAEFNEFKNKLLKNHPKMGLSNKNTDKTIIYDFNTFKNLQSSNGGFQVEARAKPSYSSSSTAIFSKKVPLLKNQIKSIYDTVHHKKYLKNDLLANHLISNLSQMRELSLSDLKQFNYLNKRRPKNDAFSPSLTVKKINL